MTTRTTTTPAALVALGSAAATTTRRLCDSLYCQLNNYVSCLLMSIPNFKGARVGRSSEQASIRNTCISVH